MRLFLVLLLVLFYSSPALAGGDAQEVSDSWIEEYPYVFPVLLYLFITTLLGYTSGWFRLARKYPDRNEPALLELRNQSGYMGPGVSMRSILHIDVCQSGLRLGMMAIFGPFNRDFFVPWEEISVKRTCWFFLFKVAELRFGTPPVGKVGVSAKIADKLARAIPEKWPEVEAPATASKP